MPIVSEKRMTRNMTNPLWEAGPDLALLFLCMKLIVSRPQDGIESSQSPIYVSAKRFLALLEATGAVSLLVLQASLLIVWFEYGQAIYPAAWMSVGWCVRYANLLGINGHPEATQLLGRTVTYQFPLLVKTDLLIEYKEYVDRIRREEEGLVGCSYS